MNWVFQLIDRLLTNLAAWYAGYLRGKAEKELKRAEGLKASLEAHKAIQSMSDDDVIEFLREHNAYKD
jgi:hypothetical protein